MMAPPAIILAEPSKEPYTSTLSSRQALGIVKGLTRSYRRGSDVSTLFSWMAEDMMEGFRRNISSDNVTLAIPVLQRRSHAPLWSKLSEVLRSYRSSERNQSICPTELPSMAEKSPDEADGSTNHLCK